MAKEYSMKPVEQSTREILKITIKTVKESSLIKTKCTKVRLKMVISGDGDVYSMVMEMSMRVSLLKIKEKVEEI